MQAKLLFFSSSRADSGILSPLIRRALRDERFDAFVLACGGHLDAGQGSTLEAELGFVPKERLRTADFLNPNSDLLASSPKALEMFHGILQANDPDVVIVLGDRQETLLFSYVASCLGLPIAHLHGGDITFGALDELHRHAITKLSSLHFAANNESARRIIQMGEHPEAVFVTGSPIQDLMNEREFCSDEEFSSITGLEPDREFALVTLHPAAHDIPTTQVHLDSVFDALDQHQDLAVIFTSPNLDQGGQELRESIERYAKSNPERVKFVKSLGARYIDALARCSVAIGNSSSLVLEAPFLGARTIVIGTRQSGRVPISECLPADSLIISTRIGASRGRVAPVVKIDGEKVSTRILDILYSRVPVSTKKVFYEL